jgi:hypothetical protein
MLKYEYNSEIIQIKESVNEKDVEFQIRFTDGVKYDGVIKRIRDFFDHNDTYTDVMFNIYSNYEYQVFVRKDFYTDFILALMKHQLLEKVEWKK